MYSKIFKYVSVPLSLLLVTGCLGAADSASISKFSPVVSGTEGDDFARNITTDASGAGYVVGELNRNSMTPARMFLSKIEQDGSLAWSVESNGDSDTYGEVVALSPDGSVYVAGFYGKGQTGSYLSLGDKTVESAPSEQTNVFVAKTDSAGKTLWLKSFDSGPLDAARGLTVDSQGYVYIAGDSASNTGTHAFLRKLDDQGNTIWLTQFKSAEYASASSVNIAKNGDLLLTGNFTNSLSIEKETLVSTGSYDGFAARLSSDGSLRWLRPLASSAANDYGYDILELSDATIAVSGYYSGVASFDGTSTTAQGGSDAYIATLSANGDVTNVKSIGGAYDDYAYSMVRKGENFVLAGRYTGSVSIDGTTLSEKSNTGLFLSEMTSGLSSVWSVSNPSTGTYYSYDAAVRPDGSLMVAAYYEEGLSVNGDVLKSVGMNDTLVYVLNP